MVGRISSCSCLTFLPGPAWVLLSKIYKHFLGSLYKDMGALTGSNKTAHQIDSLSLGSMGDDWPLEVKVNHALTRYIVEAMVDLVNASENPN